MWERDITFPPGWKSALVCFGSLSLAHGLKGSNRCPGGCLHKETEREEVLATVERMPRPTFSLSMPGGHGPFILGSSLDACWGGREVVQPLASGGGWPPFDFF